MNWNTRRRLTRRRILTLFGITAAAVTVSASTRARFRFVLNTAAHFLYGFLEPRSPSVQASEHPIQYYVSLPRFRAGLSSTAAQPQALVITIDGSDRDFWGYHAAFVRARRDLPFALVTPFVVSNGGPPNRSDYPYSADVFNAAIGDPLAFDVAGVSAIIRDLRGRFGSGLPVYLTGFSAGGHLTWLFLFTHPDLLAGAALASANFAGRGLRPGLITVPPAHVSVRAFYGAEDSRAAALLSQWDRARGEAEQRGYRDLTRVVVPGASHSPFARTVIEYFTDLAIAGGHPLLTGAREHLSQPRVFSTLLVAQRTESALSHGLPMDGTLSGQHLRLTL
jgi:dienelactone hydrolase